MIESLVPKRVARFLGLNKRMNVIETKMRFLLAENIRLNQVIRELIYYNELERTVTGSQTRQSFDYQWREIPEGRWMPSNPEFQLTVPPTIVKWTGLPEEWFRGKRVLDAGCGLGRWTHGLLKLGAHVTAADQSKGGLERTKELGKDLGPLELVETDLLKMTGIQKESFDLVWCFGVCHHTADLMRAMVNVMSAVKPGGWLFMMLYAFPESVDAFGVQAEYEEWRRKLSPLPFPEKVKVLRENFPEDLVHGYFDAVSPLINDLVTWEWIQTFAQEQGFDSVRRTHDSANHHFVARKVPRN